MAQECNKEFRKAVTIFLDILGSQDRKDFSEWHKVMSIFSGTITQEKQFDSTHPYTIYKREIHVFSDCAYIIYDYKPEIEESRKDAYALMCVACYNTEKVIFEFLRTGFIARGALTYGDIYYDNDTNVWFGPAMNRAYWLESKKARYPRLIIDPEFAAGLFDFNKKKYQQNELQKQLNGEIIKKDDDGVFYLHYLNTYELGIGITRCRDFPAQALDMCKTEIEKPRETPELKHSIEEKYMWLQRYIQKSCYNNQ